MAETITKPRFGLQAKMVVSVVFLLVLLMLVTTYMGIKRDNQGIFEQMRRDGAALAQSYALSAENAMLIGAGLARLTGEAGRTKGIEYLKIVDGNGKIIGHTETARIGRSEDDALCLTALKTPVTAVDKGKRPLIGVARNAENEEFLRVIVPLVALGKVIGVLEVGLEMDGITAAVKRTNTQSLIIAASARLLGGTCIWFFACSLTRPIRELVVAAEKIADGDLDHEIEAATRDEIGQLAASFVYMTGRLREYTGSLVLANEQLASHAALIERLRQYTENILASISPGVMTLDLDGRITTINPAGARILRLNGGETAGKPIQEAFGGMPGLWAVLLESLGELMEMHGRETAIVLGDRREALLLVNITLMRDAAETPVGLAVTFDDVTEIRQLQKRLNESEKLAAMGELVVGIAHEVRNPLGALQTCAQFLMDKFPPDDPRIRFAQIIMRESERLNQLVERLLGFARPGRKDCQYENVADLLEAAASLAMLKAREKRVELAREYDPGAPRILVDGERMEQCFLNIMLNAMEAMPAGGRLSIGTALAPGGDFLTVKFSDTGAGIPPEQIEKIFNPFFTTKNTGTGLGLAIAKQIVLEHNGTIEVQSEVGAGTTISIKLPALSGPGMDHRL